MAFSYQETAVNSSSKLSIEILSPTGERGCFYLPAGSLGSNRYSLLDSEESSEKAPGSNREYTEEDIDFQPSESNIIRYEQVTPSEAHSGRFELYERVKQLENDCHNYAQQNAQLRSELDSVTNDCFAAQQTRASPEETHKILQILQEILEEPISHNQLIPSLEKVKVKVKKIKTKNQELTRVKTHLQQEIEEIVKSKDTVIQTLKAQVRRQGTPDSSAKKSEIKESPIADDFGDSVNYKAVLKDLKDITQRASKALEVSGRKRSVGIFTPQQTQKLRGTNASLSKKKKR